MEQIILDQDAFRLSAIQRIKEGREHCSKWHREARDDYAFVAGDQWDDEDKAILREQGRPVVVFNYSEKMIDAVCGAEVSSRQECVYRPRGIEDSGVSELWTNAARWVRDECFGEDEETDGFRDCLISGMGWIETKMDYTENKDGMPIMDRIDPMEMVWDPAAIKPSLSDRRWDAHGQWMDNHLISLRWPDKLIFGSDGSDMGRGQVWHIQTGNRYDPSVNGDTEGAAEEDRRVDQTQIWDYQCCEMEYYYRVDDGSGKILEYSEADFKKVRKNADAMGLNYVKLWKKVYYRGLIADENLLEFSKSPIQAGFIRQAITGKRDRNRNMWYGLTRVMKDPQRWGNKWLSQIMHIINSNAKGGLMIEAGAATDPRRIQEEWAKPDGVIVLNEGGLNKIKEKTMSAYPNGLTGLMEFALNALPQVTGINLEALGLANRDQANVLEQSRKQAAYGLLSPIFDSLKRYRKLQGRVLLAYIMQFISDGRLIRVGGPGSEQYLPLTKMPDAVEFDIVIDSAPTAPDIKQSTWTNLMQIVPVMMKQGLPVPPDLLNYSPLPTALVASWQKYIAESKSNSLPPKAQEAMQSMQEQIQQLMKENQDLKNNNEEKIISAQTTQMETQAKLEMDKERQDAEIELKRREVESKIELDTLELQANINLKTAAQNQPTEE